MDCIFCKIVNGDIPSNKVYEDDKILAFFDISPQSVGHTLVIPKEHTKDFNSIDDETLNYIIKKTHEIVKILDDKYHMDGYSLVQNNGICQEVKHFHLHIIPKYKK